MANDISKHEKKTLGSTIRTLRREKFWSQTELAKKLETSTISVGRWERNYTRPSLYFQQKLCEVFGKSPVEFGFWPETEDDHEGEETGQETLNQTQLPPEVEAGSELDGIGQKVLDQAQPLSENHSQPSARTPLRAFSRRQLWLGGLILLLLLSGIGLSVRAALFSPPHSTTTACPLPSIKDTAQETYANILCRPATFSFALDKQDRLQWDENENCIFTHGAYHVLLLTTTYVSECFAQAAPGWHNFAFQVDITVLKGASGGLILRAERPSPNWDVSTSRVPIDIWGQYNFYFANTDIPCHLTHDAGDVNYCHSPVGTITYGLGARNTILVVTLDSTVFLYVNGTFIDMAQIPASAPMTGSLGVFATGGHISGDVAFSHGKLWKL